MLRGLRAASRGDGGRAEAGAGPCRAPFGERSQHSLPRARVEEPAPPSCLAHVFSGAMRRSRMLQ